MMLHNIPETYVLVINLQNSINKDDCVIAINILIILDNGKNIIKHIKINVNITFFNITSSLHNFYKPIQIQSISHASLWHSWNQR